MAGNTTGNHDSYHHGDLRRALIEAAEQAIDQRGADQLSLRAVARDAGVSQTAPYRHFENKDALLLAVAENGFALMAMRMAQILGDEFADEQERSIALGTSYVHFAVEYPNRFRLMFGPRIGLIISGSDGLSDSSAFGMLVQAIRQGQDSGQYRAGDPAEIALPSWSMVHGLANLVVDGLVPVNGESTASIRDLVRVCSLALLRGIGA